MSVELTKKYKAGVWNFTILIKDDGMEISSDNGEDSDMVSLSRNMMRDLKKLLDIWEDDQII